MTPEPFLRVAGQPRQFQAHVAFTPSGQFSSNHLAFSPGVRASCSLVPCKAFMRVICLRPSSQLGSSLACCQFWRIVADDSISTVVTYMRKLLLSVMMDSMYLLKRIVRRCRGGLVEGWGIHPVLVDGLGLAAGRRGTDLLVRFMSEANFAKPLARMAASLSQMEPFRRPGRLIGTVNASFLRVFGQSVARWMRSCRISAASLDFVCTTNSSFTALCRDAAVV